MTLYTIATAINTTSLPQPPATPAEIAKIIGVIFGIIGAMALLVITISGLRYITSGGNPQKAAQAKNGVVYSLVGLAIVLLAETIVAFVVGYL